MSMRIPPFHPLVAVLALLSLLPAPLSAEENACGPLTPSEERLISLQQENALLSTRLRQLEATPCLPVAALRRKKAQRLQEIASQVRSQRQATGDFQGFVTWMSHHLAGYNRYIQAGSYAAVMGRMLPIPYAGQASLFTKFLAQFTVALNASSVAVTGYLTSSQKFLALAERIEKGSPDDGAVMQAARFADRELLRDMNEAQARLSTVSELSSGALAFLGSLNHLASCGDEYWNRAKGVFRKDVDPKEKSFITESTASLKQQADRFNGKLRLFEELGKKETASVRALAVYDELEREAGGNGLLE